MTDEAKRCVESCREWYQAFSNKGKGNEPSVKELLTTADLIESLAAELEQVKRERDAAVEDIRKAAWCCCHVCKHYYQPDPNTRIHSCKKYGDFDKHDFIADDGSIFCGAFEWRGVKE